MNRGNSAGSLALIFLLIAGVFSLASAHDAELDPTHTIAASGTLIRIDKSSIDLKDKRTGKSLTFDALIDDEQVREYTEMEVSGGKTAIKKTVVMIDGKLASLEALKVGMKIDIVYYDDVYVLKSIKAFSANPK